MIIATTVGAMFLLGTCSVAGLLGYATLNFVENKFITNY